MREQKFGLIVVAVLTTTSAANCTLRPGNEPEQVQPQPLAAPPRAAGYPLVVGPARAWPTGSQWRFDPGGTLMTASHGEDDCGLWSLVSGHSLGRVSAWRDDDEPCTGWAEGLVLAPKSGGLEIVSSGPGHAQIDLETATSPDGELVAHVDESQRQVEVRDRSGQLRHRLDLGAALDWGPVTSTALVWGRRALVVLVALECRERPPCALVQTELGDSPSYRVLRWRDLERAPDSWTINWVDDATSPHWRRWEFERPEAFVLDPGGRWLIIPIHRVDEHLDGSRLLSIALDARHSGLDYDSQDSYRRTQVEFAGWAGTRKSVRTWVTVDSELLDTHVEVAAHALELWPEPGRVSAPLFEADVPPDSFDLRVLEASGAALSLAWRACWADDELPSHLELDAEGCAVEPLLEPGCTAWAVAGPRMLVECNGEWQLRHANTGERTVVHGRSSEAVAWRRATDAWLLVGERSGARLSSLDGRERWSSSSATGLLDAKYDDELGYALLLGEDELTVLDMHEGRTWTLPERGRPDAAAFSPDGASLALLRGDLVEIFDLASTNLISAWRGAQLRDVGWRRDGRIVFTAKTHWPDQAWDPSTGARRPQADFQETIGILDPSWRWAVDLRSKVVTRTHDGLRLYWRPGAALTDNGLLDGDPGVLADLVLHAPEHPELGAFELKELGEAIHHRDLVADFFAGAPLSGPRVTALGELRPAASAAGR